nr:SDR family oxidoreductase [uncultured Carboxylicivirga sp.]
METVLITGANKGIGFQVAKQLAEIGYFIYLGSRNKENGEKAIEKLKAEGILNVELIEIDISNNQSIVNARKELESKIACLDVLINNAGISGMFSQNPVNISRDVIENVFNTNFYGAIQTTQAFLDLLKKSDNPRIVNVTSDLGSLTIQSDPKWQHANIKPLAYMASKASLNAFTITLSYELKNLNFKVNSVNPGATATDLNNHMGSRTPEFAAQVIVQTATIDKDGPTGKFFSEEGELPW